MGLQQSINSFLIQTSSQFSDESKEVQSLKDELSDLYKKRSQNDQLLIDAQKKIGDLEATLAVILEAKSKLETQLKSIKQQLSEKEQKVKDIQEEKDAMGDEIITLHVIQQWVYSISIHISGNEQ